MSHSLPGLSETAQTLRQAFDLSFAQAPRMASENPESLLAIRIGGDPYAIRVTEIGGLHVDRLIMPLPTPVPELLGVTGFRGQIAPVYDLAALLGYARGRSLRWLILLRSPDQRSLVALAFDTFEMHFSVSPQSIVSASADSPAQNGTARAHLFEAAPSDEGVRPIIQLQSLLKDIQQRADLTTHKRSVPS